MSEMFKKIWCALLAESVPFTIHTIGERYALRSEQEVGGVATWVLLDKPDEIEPMLNYLWRDGNFRPISFEYFWDYIELIEGLWV